MTSFRFGTALEFELHPRERRLLLNGRRVALGMRALDALALLVEHAGQVVLRRQLMDHVWPNLAVEDNNLSVQVLALRRLLGQAAITTVPGRGYSFTLNTVRVTPTAAQRTGVVAHLPTTLPTLFGRDEELADLERLVMGHGLVTVTGAGGSGKTLLAQHLLRRVGPAMAHGACFVDLSTLASGADVVGAVAAALRTDIGAGPPAEGLAHALAGLELLLALDNAEHLLDGVGQLVLALQQAGTGVRLLVTSQAPLKVPGERLYRLRPLAIPEVPMAAKEAMAYGAIALFVDRAQAADARFDLSNEATPAAIALCRSLEGLPLAIELAAWRAPILGVRHLAESMHQPLRLLKARRRGVPPRLQTLRGALAWSYGLLGPHEQRLLRRMGVLVGSSSLALIEQMVAVPEDAPSAAPDDVVDMLSTLVERSLVALVPCADGRVRYRLLDNPRSFARTLLMETHEFDDSHRRHAEAVTLLFEQAHAQWYGGSISLAEWASRWQPALENGHAALAWLRQQDDVATMLRLLPGLFLATPREDRGRHLDMIAITADLIPRAAASLDGLRALQEATYSLISFDIWRAHALAERSVALARRCRSQHADDRWLYRSLCQFALTHLVHANLEAGQACLQEARSLESPDWPVQFQRLRWLAEVWLADRQADGQGMYQASLTLDRIARVLWPCDGGAGAANFMNGATAAGRLQQAVDHGLAAVARLEGTRHLVALTETRINLIGALVASDRLGDARRQCQSSWPHAARLFRLDVWADYVAWLMAKEGRHEDAARLVGYADQLCSSEGIVRAFNELQASRRTLAILQDHLPSIVLSACMAEGARLSEPQIARLVFAAPPARPQGQRGPAGPGPGLARR